VLEIRCDTLSTSVLLFIGILYTQTKAQQPQTHTRARLSFRFSALSWRDEPVVGHGGIVEHIATPASLCDEDFDFIIYILVETIRIRDIRMHKNTAAATDTHARVSLSASQRSPGASNPPSATRARVVERASPPVLAFAFAEDPTTRFLISFHFSRDIYEHKHSSHRRTRASLSLSPRLSALVSRRDEPTRRRSSATGASSARRRASPPPAACC